MRVNCLSHGEIPLHLTNKEPTVVLCSLHEGHGGSHKVRFGEMTFVWGKRRGLIHQIINSLLSLSQ